MKYININGKIISSDEAVLPVDNGSFRYGYGLFETMLVQDGVIKLAQYHQDRLHAGLRQLFLELPGSFTAGWMEREVLKTIQKNKAEKRCRVRLQVFAGGGGLYSHEACHAGIVIECFPVEYDGLNENGLIVGVADGIAKSADSLSNLKSCNSLVYALAARQAMSNKWNDALICNTDNRIVESTVANIFWITDGTLHTPPLSEGCIAGVMRRHIMSIINVKETPLSIDMLERAQEVFLTNAIKKVRWISQINNKKYGKAAIEGINTLLNKT